MIEMDIWRSANLLLQRYEGEAVFIAARRANALMEQDDGRDADAR
jgi:hypothetical protein